MDIKIGIGSDIHRLEPGYPFILGGINIESDKGCVAHSDGDVLIHAICDALLGAVNQRDIGWHFPDTKDENKNKSSRIFLEKVMEMVRNSGFEVGNIDTIVNLQKPKLSEHIPAIKSSLSEIMQIDISNISVKAKTSEKLGFVGEELGVKAEAIVLIYKVI